MEKIYNFTTRAQVQPAPIRTGENDFSFGMLLDIVNPLQHLPVVGMVYRAITGDTAHPVARMIGGGIYGGFVGAALATADSMIKEVSGKDTSQHIMAAFSSDATSQPELEQGKIKEENPIAPNLQEFQQAFLQYALTLQEKRSST